MTLRGLYRHQQLAARRAYHRMRDAERRLERTGAHGIYDQIIAEESSRWTKHKENVNRLLGQIIATDRCGG